MPVIARDSFAAGNLVYAWPFPIGPECEISCSDDEQVVMCPAWTVGERLGPGRHRWRSPDPSRPVAAYFVSFGVVDVEFDMITRFPLPISGQPIWIRASGSVLVRCSDPGVLVAQFIGLPFDSLDEGIRRSVARSVERMAARLLTRRVVLAGTIKAITEPSLLPEIVAELASYNPTAGAVFGIELAQIGRLYLEASDGAVTESSPPLSRPDMVPPPEHVPVYQAPTGQYSAPMFHHGEPAPVAAPAYAVPTSQPPGGAPYAAPERLGSPPYAVAGERASSPSPPHERAASQPPVSFDPLPPVAASEPSIIVNGWDAAPAAPAAPAPAAPPPAPSVPEPVGRHDTLRGIAALSPSTAAAAARASSGEAAKPPPIPPRRSPISETLPPPLPSIPPGRPATAPPAAEGSSPATPRLASEPSPSEARGSILAIGARIGEASVTSGEILAKVAPGKRVLVPGPHGLMQSATVRQLLSGYYELEVGSSGETIWVPMAHVVPE